MGKGKTISTRWSDWTNTSTLDKWLARITLITLATALNGLWLHLWVLQGIWRTIGLITMIILYIISEIVMIWRATKIPTVWWWVGFWACIGSLVVFFEIASYICSLFFGI